MGFGVWGLGFGVWGLGFGVWGLGFGVWGLGFGVHDLASRKGFQKPEEGILSRNLQQASDWGSVRFGVSKV